MPGPRPRRVFLSPSVRAEFQLWVGSGCSEHRLVQRARVILLAASGYSNAEISRRLDCSVRFVRKWRSRFTEDPRADTLHDRPRSGRPREITDEVRCVLLSLACSRPDDDKAPFRDVWTYGSLQRALESQVGQTISESEIGVILRNAHLRPHRVRYWLHSQDPDFVPKTKRICRLYRQPPKGARVLCVDEKTCIQALDRRRALVSPAAGRAGRFEHEYRRRGTTNLIGAFDPHSGEVFGRCYATRKAEDILDFMERLAKRYTDERIYIVWDNLNTHHGQRWKDFNKRHGGRFIFVHTPVHASWVNQIELWFGILQRRVLKYGIFRSVDELISRVHGFIRLWNRDESHPFNWTFRGFSKRITARKSA